MNTRAELQQMIKDFRRYVDKDSADFYQVVYWLANFVEGNYNLQFVKGILDLDILSLTPEEITIFMIICDNTITKGLNSMSFDFLKDWEYCDQLLIAVSKLLELHIIKISIISSSEPNKFDNTKSRYVLTPKAFGLLFKGVTDIVNFEKIARQVEFIPFKKIELQNLFFDEENQIDAQRASKILDKRYFDAIMSRFASRGHRQGATFVFYGAPGTGKTELVKQLAKATNRDILMADYSKMNSSFNGDTEKNLNEFFTIYKYLFAVSENAPIILFNEADAIMSKRGNEMRQAIDAVENRVKNVLLQMLEDFEGIFIATTNLIDNFDGAFERRLLYKMKFHAPNAEVRKKIWKSKIPELDSATIKYLADIYAFSGGNIENVARKYDIDLVIDNQEPSFEKICSYCDAEKYSTIVKRVGY